MLLGRNEEISQLATYYDREKSQILVMYGEKYVGKTALLREFMLDKPGFYYHADACSDKEQRYKMGLWLANLGVRTLKYPNYKDVFDCLSSKKTQKKVIVIDEFQNLIKNGSSFMEELISFIHSSWNNQEYLVILVSSSVGFVENTLVSKIGEMAFELSGFLKIKPLKFRNLRDYFSMYTNDDCLVTWSILGGYPGLWKMFDEKISVKDNIIKNIIAKDGALRNVPDELSSSSLREMNVYNTILSALSEGKRKLNDLYEHTDFSRAKISVYIKNLMELEFVNKVFSIDTEGRDNAQKGVYDISHHLIDFYYSYIYRFSSFIDFESPEEFYALRVAPTLKAYVSKYYKEVCTEYLSYQNDKNRLPVKIDKFGSWVGKQGNIDIIGETETGEYIVGLCVYDKPILTYEDYESLLYITRKARIDAVCYYLFAGNRFDEKISLEAKIKDNLNLILIDRI